MKRMRKKVVDRAGSIWWCLLGYPFVGIYRIYPIFFWRYCGKCSKLFKREYGWIEGDYVNHYLCGQCAPTYEKAKEIIFDL